VGSADPRKEDVQVVAATNRDLRADVGAGRFRSDLFYRLNIIEIPLPPLRDRREDIPYLTAAFVRDSATRMKREIRGVTAAAERALQKAPWPGNIRQLRNAIERACMLAEGGMLTERELLPAMADSRSPMSTAAADRSPASGPTDNRLATAQREQIERVLQDVGGNKAEAARRLGLSRRSMYRWIDRLGLRS
jgi:two-component system response regulator HydG